MFLVRRKHKVRLMSFKSNPWLALDEWPSSNADPDIYKQALFIFSGCLLEIPTEDKDG